MSVLICTYIVLHIYILKQPVVKCLYVTVLYLLVMKFSTGYFGLVELPNCHFYIPIIALVPVVTNNLNW
jgi:hypothetical protein